ncbi:Abcb7 [Symbiodinium necroappetens]|uniref:Abcb7 protein n=1 Tax=Symbiodinium necroappetens TaxID=1628268 RepID=A0A812LKK3_9DINO|nr:Abcb7 [Symbiodinium necroappetens]
MAGDQKLASVVPVEAVGDDDEAPKPGAIVQFTTAIYFVEEEEPDLTIDIMRLGSLKGDISVDWLTEDGSAKAGVRYEAAKGQIVMKDGEYRKQIKIKTIANDFWSPTLEFKVKLENPSGCSLGLFLKSCRVKVIDGDTFPSSMNRELLLQGEDGVRRIRMIRLLWEFWKLCFNQVKGVKTRTLVTLFLDQLRNARKLSVLLLNIYMVDVVFNTGDSTTQEQLMLATRQETALLVGICLAAPMILMHVAALVKAKMDLKGHINLFLQRALFRKYMNYSEESRNDTPPATVQGAVLSDAGDAAESYMKLLELVSIVVQLGIFIYFTLMENPEALVFILLMPCCMVIYFIVVGLIRGPRDLWKDTEDAMLFLVEEVCQRYRLVADYFQRPQMNDEFEKTSGELREGIVPDNMRDSNDEMFPKWLGPVFMAIYIALEANSVVEGRLSLGTFLATVGIMSEISDQFGEIYGIILELRLLHVAVVDLTVMFNSATDLKKQKDVNRKRREESRKARDALFSGPSDPDTDPTTALYKTDLIPIRVDNMGYSLMNAEGDVIKKLFKDVSVQVEQGKLIAVTGDHGSGKATLLRLLGGVIYPQEGLIFIPSHLRVLHVTQEALILNGTPWRNLIFGCPPPAKVDPQRVRTILQMMGMKVTLGLIEEDLQKHAKGESTQKAAESFRDAWIGSMTYSEKVKIHLARAFIMNPEVMVLQRPLHHYDAPTAAIILGLLQAHVRERGLGFPAKDREHRRPRTVFFTVEEKSQAEASDVIWRITDDGAVVTGSKG